MEDGLLLSAEKEWRLVICNLITFTFLVCLIFYSILRFSWILTPDEGASALKACEINIKTNK